MKTPKILKKLLNDTTISTKTKFVISISGGKDSKTTLVSSLPYLLELVLPEQIVVIFCDTGFEKPETIKELENIKNRLNDLGIEFKRLVSKKYPNGMIEMLKEKKVFPMRSGKFCTDELKMQPALKYYKELFLDGFEIISLVGKRRDESLDRKNIQDFENKKYRGWFFTVWHPIADWTETDVYSFLDETWGIPQSYFKGNTRVGCDECFQADLKSISLMSEDRIKEIEEVEALIGNHHIHKEYTFFFRRNSTFPNGFAPIREMVNYAKEKYNFNYHTFHTRALKAMVKKIGSKALRYKFLHYGYIPHKTNFSKYCNGHLAVPQSMQFDIEVLTTKILNAKERSDLLKFEKLEEIEKENNSFSCDCESYNLL